MKKRVENVSKCFRYLINEILPVIFKSVNNLKCVGGELVIFQMDNREALDLNKN